MKPPKIILLNEHRIVNNKESVTCRLAIIRLKQTLKRAKQTYDRQSIKRKRRTTM